MEFRLTATEALWLEYELSGSMTCCNELLQAQDPLQPFQLQADLDRNLVLNFRHASFLDSSGIGWLLSVHRALQQRQRYLVLCELPPVIERIVLMMRLDEVLLVRKNMHEVQEYLSGVN